MRSFRIPIFLLLLTLILGLYADYSVDRCTRSWTQQLRVADGLVQQEQWTAAESALEGLYDSWQAQQEWLHILIVHQELNETEELLQRCMALAQMRDETSLTPEMTALHTQFTLLEEMQHLTLRNIL